MVQRPKPLSLTSYLPRHFAVQALHDTCQRFPSGSDTTHLARHRFTVVSDALPYPRGERWCRSSTEMY